MPESTTSGIPQEAQPNKAETIEVDKEQLGKLLQEFEGMKQEISVLKEISNKDELAKYLSRHKGPMTRKCRVRTLRYENGDRKAILSWPSMVINDVFVGENGRSVAKQIVKLNMEDGSDEVVELMEYSRRYEYMDADVIKRSKDYTTIDGKEVEREIWHVKAENGKEYDIDTRFIN